MSTIDASKENSEFLVDGFKFLSCGKSSALETYDSNKRDVPIQNL